MTTALAITLFSGCVTNTRNSTQITSDINETCNVGDDLKEAELHNMAVKSFKKGEYNCAIDYLETMDARYPLGEMYPQAQLKLAYAYYKASLLYDALGQSSRFIRLNPKHKDLHYAENLIGVIKFEQSNGIYKVANSKSPY